MLSTARTTRGLVGAHRIIVPGLRMLISNKGGEVLFKGNGICRA